ncbi:hypothetical protein O6R08_02900 [Cutibacterium equinum]|uniref:Uncharacterized protein n=1 Tax=Cutibacterium equinum TaxID=3016342 RepID=A0ABY7QZL8_9ACTN|nr:hypothetical protein [Cutibacterium equinum]WCC80481.1 hypothetical protein O6R08_02900 [Cutibacterium equinum]
MTNPSPRRARPATTRRPQGRRKRRSTNPVRSIAALAVVLAILAGLGWGGYKVWKTVDPFDTVEPEGCRVTVSGQSYDLDLEQSQNAAIITAESIRRGLPAHAATIALATAMQESKLRNIDYGDRDSLGLFQQRPSQGWGSPKQVMDPWYSSGKFYEELVKFGNWKDISVNDAAQQVQRSGYPEAYRQHEALAEAWASALTGHSPSALSCINRSSETTTIAKLTQTARKGLADTITIQTTGPTVTFTATNPVSTRAAVALTMASTDLGPIDRATVATTSWNADRDHFASWTAASGPSASPAANGTGRVTGTVTAHS